MFKSTFCLKKFTIKRRYHDFVLVSLLLTLDFIYFIVGFGHTVLRQIPDGGHSQLAITCSKLTLETQEQGVKYV